MTNSTIAKGGTIVPGFLLVRQKMAGSKLRDKLYGFGDLTYKARPFPAPKRPYWGYIFRYWCGFCVFTYKELFEVCDELIPLIKKLHETGERVRPETKCVGMQKGSISPRPIYEGIFDAEYDDWLRRLVSNHIVIRAKEMGKHRQMVDDPIQIQKTAWARQALLDGNCPICGEVLPPQEPSCHGFAGCVKDGKGGFIQHLPVDKSGVGVILTP